MAKTSVNKSAYKRLKSKSLKLSERKDFNKKGRSKISQSLAPRQRQEAPQGGKNYDKLLSNIQSDYNSKIQATQKDYENKLAKKEKEYAGTFKGLNKRIAMGEKRVGDLGAGVSAELEKLYAARNSGGAQAGTGQAAPTAPSAGSTAQNITVAETDEDNTKNNETSNEETVSEEDKIENFTDTVSTAPTEGAEDPMGDSGIVDNKGKVVPNHLVSKIYKIGDIQPIGDSGYRITNLYAPRSGSNSVSGRDKGVHANGIDVVNSDGTNFPIAIADGKIVNIGLHGSGKKIDPSIGSELGYYVDIVSAKDPTKIIRYGHLDAGVFENKEALLGTVLSRGDTIFSGGSVTGSATGPHVKIYLSDVTADGKFKGNYLDQGNDPSVIVKNGF